MFDKKENTKLDNLLNKIVRADTDDFFDLARIAGVDFKTDLKWSELEEINLKGANLTDANLKGANLTSANLEGANLTNAVLCGANLTNTNLAGANLTNAVLCGVNLTSTNLEGANLTNAVLCGANLTSTNFAGTNLNNSELFGFPIRGFIDTSFVDWPGNICSVLFHHTCKLEFPYCENNDRSNEFENLNPKKIFDRLEQLRGWVDGVCITGGEPALHDKLPILLSSIKEYGFCTKIDTYGFNPRMLKLLIKNKLVDYVAMDVNPFFDGERGCFILPQGAKDLSIKKSVGILLAGQVDFEFRVIKDSNSGFFEDRESLANLFNVSDKLKIIDFDRSKKTKTDVAIYDCKEFFSKSFKPFQNSDFTAFCSKDFEVIKKIAGYYS